VSLRRRRPTTEAGAEAPSPVLGADLERLEHHLAGVRCAVTDLLVASAEKDGEIERLTNVIRVHRMREEVLRARLQVARDLLAEHGVDRNFVDPNYAPVRELADAEAGHDEHPRLTRPDRC
jgi:hypothetical protein